MWSMDCPGMTFGVDIGHGGIRISLYTDVRMFGFRRRIDPEDTKEGLPVFLQELLEREDEIRLAFESFLARCVIRGSAESILWSPAFLLAVSVTYLIDETEAETEDGTGRLLRRIGNILKETLIAFTRRSGEETGIVFLPGTDGHFALSWFRFFRMDCEGQENPIAGMRTRRAGFGRWKGCRGDLPSPQRR